MPTTDCPWGGEPQPGLEDWYFLTEEDLSFVLNFLPLSWELAAQGLIGEGYELATLCAAPHPGYPTWSLSDLLDWNVLVAKNTQWVKADTWDRYCQCKQGPGSDPCTFHEDSPGKVTLNAANAEILQEGGGGSITLRGTLNLTGSAPNRRVTYPAGAAVGDVAIVVIRKDDAVTASPPAGWTYLGGANAPINYVKVWSRVIDAGDIAQTNPTWNIGSFNYFSGTLWAGVDQASPVEAFAAAASPSGTVITAPSVTTGVDDCMVVTDYTTQLTGHPTPTAPQVIDMTGDVQYGNRGMRLCHIQVGAAGPQGPWTASDGNTDRHVGVSVALRPAAVSGDYYRWTQSLAVPMAWGYYKDQVPGPPTLRSGGGISGYWIEARFPISMGGTLPGSMVRIDVWDYAQTVQDTYQWALLVPPDVYVHYCNYEPTPQVGTWDLQVPPDPYACPTADLASIADAICTLKRNQNTMLGYLLNLNTLVSAMYGPWAGTVGQAGEYVEGHLGQFVRDSLVAQSNYYLATAVEELVASDVTGDLTIDLGGQVSGVNLPDFRIQITALPAGSGYRAAATPLYEVNRRAEQLGWCMWELSDGLTDPTMLVWLSHLVKCSEPIAEQFHLHLKLGVTADVYRVTKAHAPAL